MFAQVQEWHAKGFLMAASTKDAPSAIMQESNICPLHVYNVLDVRDFGEGRRVTSLKTIRFSRIFQCFFVISLLVSNTVALQQVLLF